MSKANWVAGNRCFVSCEVVRQDFLIVKYLILDKQQENLRPCVKQLLLSVLWISGSCTVGSHQGQSVTTNWRHIPTCIFDISELITRISSVYFNKFARRKRQVIEPFLSSVIINITVLCFSSSHLQRLNFCTRKLVFLCPSSFLPFLKLFVWT